MINSLFMTGDPSTIPPRPVVRIQDPVPEEQKQAIYRDITSADIGAIHARVRAWMDEEDRPPLEFQPIKSDEDISMNREF